MANNEDLKQPNAGAPAADIPDLKKKEKERKKSGAAWGAAKPAGASFRGAVGVARAAASAAGMTTGAASAGVGKALVVGAAALVMGGAGILGYSLLKGGAAGPSAGGDLGSLSSSVKVRSGGGDRTGYVASRGEIQFDPVKAAPAKEGGEKPEEQKAAETTAPVPDAVAELPGRKVGLEHNLSGAKLSSSLGGSFGAHNVFSGDGPKLNASMSKINIPGARLTAGARNTATGRVTRGAKPRALKAGKAFGQLRIAKGRSLLGAGSASAEGAQSQAGLAFDGSNGGGDVAGHPAGQAPTGPVNSPSTSGGAPDLTLPTVDDPNGVEMDAWRTQQKAQIGAKTDEAGGHTTMAWTWVVMAVAFAAIAVYAAVSGGVWGWIIAGAFALLAAAASYKAYTEFEKADELKAEAETMSRDLDRLTYGDNKSVQLAIDKYCIDWVNADQGRKIAECRPPDEITHAGRDAQVPEEHRRRFNQDGEVIQEP